MPDERLRYLIETRYASGSATQQASRDIKGVGTSADESTGKLDSFNSKLQSIAGISAGTAGAVAVFKKAFEFSEEGANLAQLEQSFASVNERIFRMPTLLEDMKRASRGTISEADLMAATLKLTAGASDELAAKLAQASPQLLEIAKAANKVNPTLGDTAFLYDSITTGIKRASPLILDNLGIVIKVGEANEKYAAALGKSVTELTAEEKAMALLNGTLEAGQNLINQAGGDVDSYADSWAQLRVQIKETGDEAKQTFASRLLPVMKALSGQYGDEMQSIIDSNLEAALSVSALQDELGKLQSKRGFGSWITGTTDELDAGMKRIVLEMAMMSTSAEELQQRLLAALGDDTYINSLDLQAKNLNEVRMLYAELSAKWLPDYQKSQEELARSGRDMAQAQMETTRATDDYSGSLERLARMGHDAAQGQQDAADKAAWLEERTRAAARQAELAAGPWGEYNRALEGNASYARSVTDSSLVLMARLEELAGNEQIAADKAQHLGEMLGAIPTDVHASVDISVIGFQYLTEADALLRKLSGYGGPAAGIGTGGTPGSGGGAGGGAYNAIPGGQHGMHMMVPPGFYNDNFLFRASSREEVIIRTPQQQAMGKMPVGGGGGDTYEYNIYATSREAMALALATARQKRRSRLDGYMGVP